MSNLSLTYRLLRFIGLNYSEKEYGQVSILKVVKRVLKTYRDVFLMKFMMESWLLSPIAPRKLRPWILKKTGAKIGKNVFIGSRVYFDTGHADLMTIEDNAHITARCLLLCHQRDISSYYIGDDASKLRYITGKIHIKKGAMIGMNTMIMPGVTIGEGAIIGAYSLVTKDIPAWTIATGRPARVVKKIPEQNKDIS